MGYTKKRKAIKGQRVRVVSVGIDAVTDCAVRVLMKREGMSFSAGICALATASALKDSEMMAAIKALIADRLAETMEETGYHPGLSRELARELTTGHKQPHPDLPMVSLDTGDKRYQGEGKAVS